MGVRKQERFFLWAGYFTHVTTLAEVKEQVLKYVPVMARPMVMYRKNHPVQWTGVYADVEVRERLSLPYCLVMSPGQMLNEFDRTRYLMTELCGSLSWQSLREGLRFSK